MNSLINFNAMHSSWNNLWSYEMWKWSFIKYFGYFDNYTILVMSELEETFISFEFEMR